MRDRLELLDWKRRVFELYARIRHHEDAAGAWEMWVRARDELFKWHPQSPLSEGARAMFERLDYFDYSPDFRVTATVDPVDAERRDVPASVSGRQRLDVVATARFALGGEDLSLDLFWVPGYGGGLFLPFRDATSGTLTYGGGRYLLDTIKGADLGMSGDALLLDFNFAYNPSCCYDPRWDCPLTPASNQLPLAVTAGEKAPAVTT